MSRLIRSRSGEVAGVTKSVAYDHFGDRSGVFFELYRAFEHWRHETLDAALDDVAPVRADVAAVAAAAYIDCHVVEGRELSDVIHALSASSELDSILRRTVDEYLARCREVLAPFGGDLGVGGLTAIVGAGDIIAIGIPNRSISLEVSDEELTRRRDRLEAHGTYRPRQRERSVSTALRAYAAFEQSADRGAVRKVPEVV